MTIIAEWNVLGKKNFTLSDGVYVRATWLSEWAKYCPYRQNMPVAFSVRKESSLGLTLDIHVTWLPG